MEHDRITDLLRRTPQGIPEPQTNTTALLRRFRRRRARRLIASSAAAAVAALGLVVPLALLANVGSRSQPISSPRMSSGPAAPGMRDVGRFTCRDNGMSGTGSFAVQPDGPHLHISNPGGFRTFELTRVGGRGVFPIHLNASGPSDRVEPFLNPGDYLATCSGASRAIVGGLSTLPVMLSVHVGNPDGVWIDPAVHCSPKRRALVPTTATDRSRHDVPDSIRASVVGIGEADRIEAAGYPESSTNITFLVRRGDWAIAVVRLVGRSLPLHAPGLDVTACASSGVGAGQEVR
jgi:hypothetical protein